MKDVHLKVALKFEKTLWLRAQFWITHFIFIFNVDRAFQHAEWLEEDIGRNVERYLKIKVKVVNNEMGKD